MEDRKLNLLKALEKERDNLNRAGHDVPDHDIAIRYLKDGTAPSGDVYQFDLLYAIINDFESLCLDYGV